MPKKFAKLFELDNNIQVLVSKSHNSNENLYEINIRTDFGEMSASATISFEDEGKCCEAIEDYSKENAIAFRNEMERLFS